MRTTKWANVSCLRIRTPLAHDRNLARLTGVLIEFFNAQPEFCVPNDSLDCRFHSLGGTARGSTGSCSGRLSDEPKTANPTILSNWSPVLVNPIQAVVAIPLSKRVFTFLMLFSSLAETGAVPQVPSLTLPVQ